MRRRIGLGILATVSALAFGATAQAGVISGAIDNNKLVTLTNNTRSEANALNDRGRVDDSVKFGGMQLLLKRSPEQEVAFERLIADLHNPQSPNFHRWLSNAEIGQRYGLGEDDIGQIKDWMKSNGLKVKAVSPDHSFITFSGNNAAISKAFHTEIHTLSVNGDSHFANMSNPKIPAALRSAVAGVVSMNDFRAHTNFSRKFKTPLPQMTVTSGCYPAIPTGTHNASYTNRCFLVTPGDLAAIYDMKAAFDAGITGQGQTVVVVEDTNVYKMAAWNTFRAVMGLNKYTHATFTTVHPTGAAACANPGVIWGNDGEAILDAEYASASAPDANIVLASCSDTGTNNVGFGGLKAIQNMMATANPPKIFSMSYGECETENGATSNAAYNTTYQNAAAQGISIYVSSGDESATSCDPNATRATHGIGVSGFQSSPYNISVGGTDYSDTTNRNNATLWQTYWNDTTGAGNGYASAKSYIPEIPWNNSCASEVTATFYTGSNVTYGTSGFCNNTFATGSNNFLSTGSGSGGPSGCATGASASGANNTGIVGGTCAGWPKPAYQAGFKGIVADGVRDTPDVSLFAANGVWGHWFPYCDYDPAALGSTSTANAPGCMSGNPYNWAGAGGTSFSSPIWAGIQALINQKTNASWGNTNVQYYALAAAEYGVNGNPNCDSSLGTGASSSCVFHDVTAGDYNVNCRAGTGSIKHNCYLPSSTNGVGTTDSTNNSYVPMYKSASGWDFTTGVGTPDVNNLVNAFAQIGH